MGCVLLVAYGGRVDLSGSEGHIETTSCNFIWACYWWFRYGREKHSPYSTTELLKKTLRFLIRHLVIIRRTIAGSEF